ncbi:hypothetical protein B0H67DRAFT_579947 [Lasiosphaeris hirsuta]|uniref:Uncharacterized protein n=1 Tax=Lasiosphaeris hirsuta TaxID=260670 RepID=A0AA40AFW0_9PEZI|nr:hypothetical protein B0H67DRAFT_579947 [Lasiosphaeris hirsuta]
MPQKRKGNEASALHADKKVRSAPRQPAPASHNAQPRQTRSRAALPGASPLVSLEDKPRPWRRHISPKPTDSPPDTNEWTRPSSNRLANRALSGPPFHKQGVLLKPLEAGIRIRQSWPMPQVVIQPIVSRDTCETSDQESCFDSFQEENNEDQPISVATPKTLIHPRSPPVPQSTTGEELIGRGQERNHSDVSVITDDEFPHNHKRMKPVTPLPPSQELELEADRTTQMDIEECDEILRISSSPEISNNGNSTGSDKERLEELWARCWSKSPRETPPVGFSARRSTAINSPEQFHELVGLRNQHLSGLLHESREETLNNMARAAQQFNASMSMSHPINRLTFNSEDPKEAGPEIFSEGLGYRAFHDALDHRTGTAHEERPGMIPPVEANALRERGWWEHPGARQEIKLAVARCDNTGVLDQFAGYQYQTVRDVGESLRWEPLEWLLYSLLFRDEVVPEMEGLR